MRLVVATALALGAACGEARPPGGRGRAATAFAVEVAQVSAQTVDYAVHGVGSVEAFERVMVTARVAGVVERVRFAEGDVVKKGAVLVEIEPARYQVAERAARAAKDRAEAQQLEAEGAAARRDAVVRERPGLIPQEELEGFHTKARLAKAEVDQAQASLEQAALNLRDAYAVAPIAGVMETRSVQTGQYVQPGTVLATLVRKEPLLLRFAVTLEEADRLRLDQEASFVVRADPRPRRARLVHVGQAADDASRLVPVTAQVVPDDGADLRPGSFAEVTVPVGSGAAALVVPQKAVRPGERGVSCFVVEGEVAKEHLVTLGMRTAAGEVEVLSGLHPGEQLVIRGGEALYDGAKVRVIAGAAGVAPPAGDVPAAAVPGPAPP